MNVMERVRLDRDRVSLSCLRAGDTGSLVVLLHGLAGSAEEFRATATALLPEHRVIALDQRGHGHSDRRPEDLSRQAYVDDVVAIIETLGDGGPVALVGQSMGAHTALLVAARHPGLVERLVLLEGGVGGDGADGYPARLGEWFASWPVPFADAEAALSFLGDRAVARVWARDLERRDDGLWPRFDPDIMETAIKAVADGACWADWQRVTAPTLLVLGERGALNAAEVQRMRTERPEVDYVVVPDAGHDVHLEQPDAWVRLLRAYLGQN